MEQPAPWHGGPSKARRLPTSSSRAAKPASTAWIRPRPAPFVKRRSVAAPPSWVSNRSTGHSDGLIEPGLALRRDLAEAFRRLHPDIVVTMNFDLTWGENENVNHADHRATGLAVLDACRDWRTGGCSPKPASRGAAFATCTLRAPRIPLISLTCRLPSTQVWPRYASTTRTSTGSVGNSTQMTSCATLQALPEWRQDAITR